MTPQERFKSQLIAIGAGDGDAVAARKERLETIRAETRNHLGTRSVIDYLLSPIQKVAHEAGRER